MAREPKPVGPPAPVDVLIRTAADIVAARQEGRSLAQRLGFSGSDLTLIATAISELARNIIEYAKEGRISIGAAQRGSRWGIVIVASDEGPGIPDISKALTDGYSTGKGLGLGLPGVKRLMHEFDIASHVARGTTVTARRWVL